MDSPPAWFALILQGGSFAVLVYLITWMLPTMRKEMAIERKAELDENTSINKEQRLDFTAALASVTVAFKDEARQERLSCEKHFETLASAVGKGNEATITAVKTMADQIFQHAVRNQQWSDVLKAEIEKHGGSQPTQS